MFVDVCRCLSVFDRICQCLTEFVSVWPTGAEFDPTGAEFDPNWPELTRNRWKSARNRWKSARNRWNSWKSARNRWNSWKFMKIDDFSALCGPGGGARCTTMVRTVPVPPHYPGTHPPYTGPRGTGVRCMLRVTVVLASSPGSFYIQYIE